MALIIFSPLSELPFSSLTLTLQALVTSHLAEPLGGDPVWRNRSLVAVLVQEPGHWLTYLHQNLLWWKLDTGGGGTVVQQNPFQHQGPRHVIMMLAFRQ